MTENRDEAPPTYENKEDRKKHFIALLERELEKTYAENSKFETRWGEFVKRIEHDRHFNALETGGQRKQCYHEVLQRVEKNKVDLFVITRSCCTVFCSCGKCGWDVFRSCGGLCRE